MACTLQELQNTEYDVLCKFADFCDAHKIPYGLSGGTLLGAIRHGGFIPWDDDIDVHMEIHAFRKFVRLYRRHPIPGLHLSWIDTDPEHPFFFAKLRKNGTFMPEESLRRFDMHNGVWIDIFGYTGIPKGRLRAKLQSKALQYFKLSGQLYFFRHDPDIEHPLKQTRIYRFVSGLSYKSIRRIRKALFGAFVLLGSRRSERLIYTDWITPEQLNRLRSDELPLCRHPFGEREFSIPQNYDSALTKQYGDYMTPAKFPSHTNLSVIQL